MKSFGVYVRSLALFCAVAVTAAGCAYFRPSPSPPPTPSAAPGESAVPVTLYRPNEQADALVEDEVVELDRDKLEDGLISVFGERYSILIDSLSINEGFVTVDLNQQMLTAGLDWGSAGSWMMVGTLYKTLFSMGFVETIQVLVDGKSGVSGNHFSFEEPMTLPKFQEMEAGYAGNAAE